MAYQGIPPAAVAMQDYITDPVASDVTDIDMTSLNGDQDGDYSIIFDVIVKASSNMALTLQPIIASGVVSTGQSSEGFSVTNGAAPVALSDTTLFINGENTATDQHIVGNIYLTTKTGRLRQFYSFSRRAQTAVCVAYNVAGVWTNTTDNITGIRLHSSVATSLRANSFFKLRKLKNTL